MVFGVISFSGVFDVCQTFSDVLCYTPDIGGLCFFSLLLLFCFAFVFLGHSLQKFISYSFQRLAFDFMDIVCWISVWLISTIFIIFLCSIFLGCIVAFVAFWCRYIEHWFQPSLLMCAYIAIHFPLNATLSASLYLNPTLSAKLHTKFWFVVWQSLSFN